MTGYKEASRADVLDVEHFPEMKRRSDRVLITIDAEAIFET
jgi:hypothetical protein